MLTLLSIGAGLVSLLLGATGTETAIFRMYFSSPMLIVLNLLPLIFFVFLIYFISGRAWIAFSFPTFLVLALSSIEFFKIQVRSEPFTASDFIFSREAGNILSSYSLKMDWKIYLAIAAFALGVLFSIFCLKHRQKNTKVRIITSIIITALSVMLYIFVYTGDEIYEKMGVEIRAAEWSSVRKYVTRGFVYPFVHSIKESLSDNDNVLPDWYDEQEAMLALETYEDIDIPDDKKVSIISILLESYADLSIFDMLDFNIDVYAPLHKLQAESDHGMLLTNTFGGGTIDTERLFLTGNTFLTTYRAATNSYVHYLKNQGYYTEGLHAGDSWFYDRRLVNTYLGFDRYYFLEDYEHGDRADAFFFPAVIDLYMARDKSKPYFNFSITYQNHGAYDSTMTYEPHYIAQNGLSDESFFILNNYLSGIYDTSRHIDSFIDSFRTDPDPVVLVFFGDHMPWLGNDQSVYNELGINIDEGTEEGVMNSYCVPYLVWANDAAKENLSNDFIGDGGIFSPCFLMGEVFRLCSWEGEGYMQALRELKATVDIIHTPTGLYCENGVLKQELTPESWAAYLKLRKMETYRRMNYKYS